jgi:hypothetical protein
MTCPTCGSPDPGQVGARLTDGELHDICTDKFHEPLPPVRDESNRKGHGTVIGRQDF